MGSSVVVTFSRFISDGKSGRAREKRQLPSLRILTHPLHEGASTRFAADIGPGQAGRRK
jgi:hypothetical protein